MATALWPQSYQSSFSEVKFDRVKGPATFTAGVEVAAATGAVSMDIPFGPGIGTRGLKFQPRLNMRLAPQIGVSTHSYYSVSSDMTGGCDCLAGIPGNYDTLFQRHYGSSTFSPGTFNLALMPYIEDDDAPQSSYSLPDGNGGYDFGAVPAGMTPAVAQTLLARFGLASESVAYLPGDTTRSTKKPFIQMGSAGHLILGLRSPGTSNQFTDEIKDWVQQDPLKAGGAKWDFPARILVVQGDVAYKFTYVSHSYTRYTIPYIATGEKAPLTGAHYLLTHIINRFGENISFEYNASGIGYTATWSRNPSVKIVVSAVEINAAGGTRDLRGDNYADVTKAYKVSIEYQGITPAISPIDFEFSSLSKARAGDPPGVGAALTGQRGTWGTWGGGGPGCPTSAHCPDSHQ